RRTVMELVSGACSERIYPVGRLDRNTTGLLMFTNDGELTDRLTHPRYGIKKIYHVTLDQNVAREDMDKIAEGMELEDGFIKADEINYVDASNTKDEIGIEIHSGRNRIIRRIFEALGYKVLKLDRVYFGGLTKKNLPKGRWRMLTEQEIIMLKMTAK
ncbi:MAG TPA: pseudouridine synthase, partial [Bacteroidia bacterium]|nr:pseudouridine synthase [Bacteroidia bacterium]